MKEEKKKAEKDRSMVRPEEGAEERKVEGKDAHEMLMERLNEMTLEQEEKEEMDSVKKNLFP